MSAESEPETAAVWSTRVTKSKAVIDKKTGGVRVTITAKLLCNGRAVHELTGPCAEERIEELASWLTKCKSPEPPAPITTAMESGTKALAKLL